MTRGNLVGKVVWYSGEKNLLAEAIGFVTGKIGFLSCIVIPVLLISGVLLRDSVKDIQKEIQDVRKEKYIEWAMNELKHSKLKDYNKNEYGRLKSIIKVITSFFWD